MPVLLRRGGHTLLTPVRLFRRRISVQLAASHLLVVILTVAIINGAFVASLYGLVPQDVWGDEVGLDITIGEKARTVSVLVGADAVAAASQPGATAARAAIERTLRAIVEVPSATGADAASPPPPLTLDRVTHALVTDAGGRVVASSDGAWAPVGQPVARVTFPLVPELTAQALALQGELLYYQERYVIDVRDEITVASYPVLTADGRLVGTVALQSEPFDLSSLPSRREVVRDFLGANLTYWRFVFVAAVLLAVLVGLWRARAVSGRLSRLAAAADAMGRGDLSRRVPVQGTDEISRLADCFNDMSERLAAADRARRAFVANVSHELRTPVAIIQGHLERLLETDPRQAVLAGNDRHGPNLPSAIDPTPTDALATMHQETLTLSRLIDDLFTLARLEETALPVEAAPVRLDELAAEAVEGLRTLAWQQRKVTVQTLIARGLPPVVADRTRTRQVLNNLLYNALRHTPEGGLIIVDAAAHPNRGLVEVSVADTGVGIAPEELVSVFDRFYRGERRQGGDGTGLGLHIVKQLVEAQRGTVAVASEPGRGTTFRFTLPLAP